jgi:hypothetical protein
MIKKKLAADSLNAFVEWFHAGFSRVTGTPIDAEERSGVYNLSAFYRT